MKITEHEYQHFFNGLEFRDTVIPTTGEICQMPLTGEIADQMASFHVASRAKVLELLPIKELVPLELPGDKTLIGFIGIEYKKRNIESYSEVVVVVPVRLGKGAPPPTPQDMMSDNFGGAVLYIHHLAVTTRLAEIVGNEILGYNKFMADISFVDMPDERICIFSEGGKNICRFSVGVNSKDVGEPERNVISVATYKGKKINKLTYSSQAKYATSTPDRGCVVFGDHPLTKFLENLEIEPKAMLTQHTANFQLISDEKNLEVIEF